MKYTIQVFKSNRGTEANNRIAIPYQCDAADVGEAYEKARKDLEGIDVKFGFIVPAELDVLY